ncbi:Peptidase family M23 [Bosea sp. OK403]|uniref:M23 family metallopeptidase n=1 Tax=Bosea sp. OK403 TaxID=1855286 RepID=UPI0008E624C0|nr:M23 family metallopeptidase [Bosea sp. OK403]SFI68290.1 Peptidase family M23 [Bosea sp. OK403]
MGGAELNFLYDDSAEPLADPFATPAGLPVSEHRSVNWRWLCACALIGLLGAALMGSSLYVSEGDHVTAQRPEKATPAHNDETAVGKAAHKGDSLVQHSFAISTTQHFRAPLTETSAGREITKVHAFAHVSVALSPLPVANLEIPDFDPARLLAGSTREAPPQDATDPADADVSVTRRDLAALVIAPDAPGLSDAAIDEQIAEMARLSAGSPQLPPDYSNQRILSRTLRMVGESASAEADAEDAGRFGSLDVRIIPENVTDVSAGADNRERFGDVDIALERGQTLAAALASNGASSERVAAILAALGKRARGDLPDGQHLRVTIGPEAGERTIQRVTLFDESGPQQVVALDDQGRFVTVALPARGHDGTEGKTDADDEEDDGNNATLYQSAYASALKSDVPREVIDDVIRAFAAGLDLKQHAGSGDRLELVFTDDQPTPANHRELLYAALSTGGETQQIYRYVSSETGELDYLDDDGVSLKKLLMRKPVQEGRISSPFGMRYHPILHYSRLHNGVDWAAPRGTPIMAAGDGTVTAAGVHSGYGNRVELEHANGYTSAYNHMASIARRIKPGASVHMGEIIGYVGTTGLSTGPHVHYEVTTNGHFVDPMKVKLPSSRALQGAALAEFKEHKKQVDDLRHHVDATVAVAPGGHPT